MIKLKDLLIEAADSDFRMRAEKHLARLTVAANRRVRRHYSSLDLIPDVFSFDKGKSHWKIVKTPMDGGRGITHSFIDVNNGDVLASTGNAPTKIVLGNIYDANFGVK